MYDYTHMLILNNSLVVRTIEEHQPTLSTKLPYRYISTGTVGIRQRLCLSVKYRYLPNGPRIAN
jgi:hypothetical protein